MEYTDALIIGVIVGLIELIKLAGAPKRVLPILSVVLGLAFGTVYLFPGDIKAGILTGLIVGLSSTGLYSGAKNTIENEGGR